MASFCSMLEELSGAFRLPESAAWADDDGAIWRLHSHADAAQARLRMVTPYHSGYAIISISLDSLRGHDAGELGAGSLVWSELVLAYNAATDSLAAEQQRALDGLQQGTWLVWLDYPDDIFRVALPKKCQCCGTAISPQNQAERPSAEEGKLWQHVCLGCSWCRGCEGCCHGHGNACNAPGGLPLELVPPLPHWYTSDPKSNHAG